MTDKAQIIFCDLKMASSDILRSNTTKKSEQQAYNLEDIAIEIRKSDNDDAIIKILKDNIVKFKKDKLIISFLNSALSSLK